MIGLIVAVALLSGLGYVLAVAGTAPDLSELKPADKGANSEVLAADGSRLGYVQSDEIRTPIALGGPDARHPPGRDRDRGRALLQAQGRGLRRHRARRGAQRRGGQERPGRLHPHPAARPGPLHQGSAAQRAAQDPRGQAGHRAREEALQALDPHELPQRRAVRDRQRPYGDRDRGRGRDLLRQARPGADAARGRRCWPGCPRPRRSTTRSGIPARR
ncbi:MAG: hypothetical protein WKF40_11720 [Thermoleophilaceae bacterium]